MLDGQAPGVGKQPGRIERALAEGILDLAVVAVTQVDVGRPLEQAGGQSAAPARAEDAGSAL